MRTPFITAALLSIGMLASGSLSASSEAVEPGSQQRASRRSQKNARANSAGRSDELRAVAPEGDQDIDLVPPLKAADDYQLQVWFKNCDPDDNNWISFAEARYSLGFGRGLYLTFDENQDGRLAKKEFVAYYNHAMKRNQFRRPKIRSKPVPPERTPRQLMLAYDADLDSGISLSEATRLLSDYSRTQLDTTFLFSRVDLDRNRLLNVRELQGLSQAVRHLNQPRSQGQATEAPSREGIDGLFLEIIPSSNRMTPPTLVGPVTTFRRLDLDGNGKISLKDLEGLKRTIATHIRVGTVLHTLDTDQDGVLNRNELRRSMEKAPEPK